MANRPPNGKSREWYHRDTWLLRASILDSGLRQSKRMKGCLITMLLYQCVGLLSAAHLESCEDSSNRG